VNVNLGLNFVVQRKNAPALFNGSLQGCVLMGGTRFTRVLQPATMEVCPIEVRWPSESLSRVCHCNSCASPGTLVVFVNDIVCYYTQDKSIDTSITD
jgi:hypothetical protein